MPTSSSRGKRARRAAKSNKAKKEEAKDAKIAEEQRREEAAREVAEEELREAQVEYPVDTRRGSLTPPDDEVPLSFGYCSLQRPADMETDPNDPWKGWFINRSAQKATSASEANADIDEAIVQGASPETTHHTLPTSQVADERAEENFLNETSSQEAAPSEASTEIDESIAQKALNEPIHYTLSRFDVTKDEAAAQDFSSNTTHQESTPRHASIHIDDPTRQYSQASNAHCSLEATEAANAEAAEQQLFAEATEAKARSKTAPSGDTAEKDNYVRHPQTNEQEMDAFLVAAEENDAARMTINIPIKPVAACSDCTGTRRRLIDATKHPRVQGTAPFHLAEYITSDRPIDYFRKQSLETQGDILGARLADRFLAEQRPTMEEQKKPLSKREGKKPMRNEKEQSLDKKKGKNSLGNMKQKQPIEEHGSVQVTLSREETKKMLEAWRNNLAGKDDEVDIGLDPEQTQRVLGAWSKAYASVNGGGSYTGSSSKASGPSESGPSNGGPSGGGGEHQKRGKGKKKSKKGKQTTPDS